MPESGEERRGWLSRLYSGNSVLREVGLVLQGCLRHGYPFGEMVLGLCKSCTGARLLGSCDYPAYTDY